MNPGSTQGGSGLDCPHCLTEFKIFKVQTTDLIVYFYTLKKFASSL